MQRELKNKKQSQLEHELDPEPPVFPFPSNEVAAEGKGYFPGLLKYFMRTTSFLLSIVL